MKFKQIIKEARQYKSIKGKKYYKFGQEYVRPHEFEVKYKYFFDEIENGNIEIIGNRYSIYQFISDYKSVVEQINNKKIIIKNAVLKYEIGLSWISGDWLKGECNFLNEWISGTFENGILNGSTWGRRCNGIFKGTWKFGVWDLFNKAIFKGKWIKGKYLDYDGRIHDDEGLSPDEFKKKHADEFHLSGRI